MINLRRIFLETIVVRRINLRRIFLETIVLRRINLRGIFKEFNCSEEDISRNNGSEEDICEEDFLKERLLGRFCQK